MKKEDIIEIVNNVKDKPNKVLLDSKNLLLEEFNKTKELIIDLTRHLESVESNYIIIDEEITKRTK